ncbi:MAG: ImmA/IrrE family metallo-endopeptidase [Bacteroidota bacterium]
MLAYDNAEKLISKYCFESPRELNLVTLLYAEDLNLKEEPLSDCEGKILFDNSIGIITLNSSITDERQKRFTLAHEMGHFFNEALTKPLPKGEAVYKCGFEEFYGVNKSRKREADANEFAAELLMHKPWFQKFTKNKPINFELLKDTSDYFDVSLTAVALRYVFVGQYSTALIMNKNGKVLWSAVNEYFPLKFIPTGYKVRKESAAYDFFSCLADRRDLTPGLSPYKGERGMMQTCYDLVPAYTWFSEDYNCPRDKYLYEQNVAMYNYNCVLTLLWEK